MKTSIALSLVIVFFLISTSVIFVNNESNVKVIQPQLNPTPWPPDPTPKLPSYSDPNPVSQAQLALCESVKVSSECLKSAEDVFNGKFRVSSDIAESDNKLKAYMMNIFPLEAFGNSSGAKVFRGNFDTKIRGRQIIYVGTTDGESTMRFVIVFNEDVQNKDWIGTFPSYQDQFYLGAYSEFQKIAKLIPTEPPFLIITRARISGAGGPNRGETIVARLEDNKIKILLDLTSSAVDYGGIGNEDGGVSFPNGERLFEKATITFDTIDSNGNSEIIQNLKEDTCTIHSDDYYICAKIVHEDKVKNIYTWNPQDKIFILSSSTPPFTIHFLSPKKDDVWTIGTSQTITFSRPLPYQSHCSNYLALIDQNGKEAGILDFTDQYGLAQGFTSLTWNGKTLWDISCGTSGKKTLVTPGKYRLKLFENDASYGVGKTIEAFSDYFVLR